MSNTPRTDACWEDDDCNILMHARQLERELAEALEWKHYLSSWGGTPEIVFSFIQGQQARISAAQAVEKQLSVARELAESNGKLAHDAAIEAMRYRDQLKITVDALTQLRDCDWVITLPDRMDAVREIARETLNKIKP